MSTTDRATLDEMLTAGRDDIALARAARERGDNLQALRCLSCAESYVATAKAIFTNLERKARK